MNILTHQRILFLIPIIAISLFFYQHSGAKVGKSSDNQMFQESDCVVKGLVLNKDEKRTNRNSPTEKWHAEVDIQILKFIKKKSSNCGTKSKKITVIVPIARDSQKISSAICLIPEPSRKIREPIFLKYRDGQLVPTNCANWIKEK